MGGGVRGGERAQQYPSETLWLPRAMKARLGQPASLKREKKNSAEKAEWKIRRWYNTSSLPNDHPRSCKFLSQICFFRLSRRFFVFSSFFFSAQHEGESGKCERKRTKRTRHEKKKRPNTVREPAISKKQSSSAPCDKRAARWAIRKELPEQMPASRADVKSKARKLTSWLLVISHSRNQRAKVINCTRVRTIQYPFRAETKLISSWSKTLTFEKRVPFSVFKNFRKFD